MLKPLKGAKTAKKCKTATKKMLKPLKSAKAAKMHPMAYTDTQTNKRTWQLYD